LKDLILISFYQDLTTLATTTTIPTTTVSVEKTIFQCYECSGPECGKEGSGISTNCPSCMVYRNPSDQSNFFYETRLDYFEKYKCFNSKN